MLRPWTRSELHSCPVVIEVVPTKNKTGMDLSLRQDWSVAECLVFVLQIVPDVVDRGPTCSEDGGELNI